MAASGEKKRSIAGYLLLVINIFFAAALLLADLANYISPAMYWEVALFGLAFPFLVFINLAFLCLWLFRKRIRFLISFVILLISWKNISSTVQFHFMKEKHSSASALKIISFNVRLFDYYNWSRTRDTRTKIYHLLKEESPSILCMQEFFSSGTRRFNNRDTLSEFLSDQNKKYYSHVEVSETKRADDQYGAATFSIYPIVGKGKIVFAERSHNICMWTDLQIGTDTVRVFNVHMQSIRFETADYKFIENLFQETEQMEIDGSLKILKRLKKAFIKRSLQTDLVADEIHKSPYRVILCGDLNDTPSSYTYQKLTEHLEDSFKESGWGFAKTYTGSFPSFRIDYILHDKSFSAFEYHTIREKLSDHFPVTCFLESSNQK